MYVGKDATAQQQAERDRAHLDQIQKRVPRLGQLALDRREHPEHDDRHRVIERGAPRISWSRSRRVERQVESSNGHAAAVRPVSLAVVRYNAIVWLAVDVPEKRETRSSPIR